MAKEYPGLRNLLVYIGDGYDPINASHLEAAADRDGMHCTALTLVVGKQPLKYNDSTQQKQVIDSCAAAVKNFWKTFMKSRAYGLTIYIGLSALDISTPTAIENASAMYGAYKNYIDAMAKAINSVYPNDFEMEVGGFYFTSEKVDPAYKKISPTSPTSTSSVKLMSDLSNYIRSLDKEFIWAPYYGYGINKEIITYNLGVIANRTNIFDRIYVQPAYYFWPNDCDERNITAVRNSLSIRNGAGSIDKPLVDLSNKPIEGGRSSNAKAYIGAVMELNGNVTSGDYARRYQLYVDAFGDLGRKADLIFYAGPLPNIVTTSALCQRITDVYNV